MQHPAEPQRHEDDNWYRDDWFNRQDQWHEGDDFGPPQPPPHHHPQLPPPHQQPRSYEYHREMDDRQIHRLRSPSPERPRWTNRDMLSYNNRSLDRGMERYMMTNGPHSTSSLPRIGVDSTARALGEAWGIPVAAGRKLPKPPPEAQRAVLMANPNTPLPLNQKPERLSTRNRLLPQIPSSTNVIATTTNTITNSIFGFAKKLTGSHQTHQQQQQPLHMQQQRFQQGQQRVLPTAPPLNRSNNMMRPSQSFGNSPQTLRKSGRNAKLPMIPNAAAAGNNRRHLPQFFSRSLDEPKLETVVEAGRGVRKLPVPVVRNGTVNQTPYERIMMGGSSATLPQPGSTMIGGGMNPPGMMGPNNPMGASGMMGNGSGPPMMANGSGPPLMGNGSGPPMLGNGTGPPMMGNGNGPPMMSNGAGPPMMGPPQQPMPPSISIQQPSIDEFPAWN